MILNGRVKVNASTDGVELIIPFRRSEIASLREFEASVEQFDDGDDIEVKIDRKRKKRSLDANAYLWVLIGECAKVLECKPIDVYRTLIKDYGVYQIIPVKEEAIPRWKSIWEGRGVGWLVDDLGECRNTAGYHNMRCFFGTSSYDSKEMGRIINGCVEGAKGLGIQTMTPQEIARLKGV